MNLAKAKAVIDAGHAFEFHIKDPISLSSTRIVSELSDPFVESLKCST